MISYTYMKFSYMYMKTYTIYNIYYIQHILNKLNIDYLLVIDFFIFSIKFQIRNNYFY